MGSFDRPDSACHPGHDAYRSMQRVLSFMVSIGLNVDIWRNATCVGRDVGFAFSTINRRNRLRKDGFGVSCIFDANFSHDLDSTCLSGGYPEIRRVAATSIFSPIKPSIILSNKMKRPAALVTFAVIGAVTGTTAACIVLALAPVCGYDCENHATGVWFFITSACLIGFPLLGHVFTRGTRLTLKRGSIVAAGLVTAVLLGAGCFYVLDLHRHYVDAEADRSVRADFDFMYMSITTRDVQTYTKAENGLTKPLTVIPQWQRCAIDGAWCDANPKQVHMRCKTGVVYVNAADWSAFSLVPRENIPGAVPMKSMNRLDVSRCK